MTFLSPFPFSFPQKQHCFHPPQKLEAHDVSLIVPVKNNQTGLNALLDSLINLQNTSSMPGEILIVDNLSSPGIVLAPQYQKHLPVRLLQCVRPGSASARNVGAKHAHGCWLWFCDSDCRLSDASLNGFRQALNGAIGYAGTLHSWMKHPISQYYQDQHILIPPAILHEEDVRPHYIITANALVYQPAFIAVSGFREDFPYAAGEDIDLGLRLWQVGLLSFAPDALVYHDFEADLISFVTRFIRYGRGNWHLSTIYQSDLTPGHVSPLRKNMLNWFLAFLQWGSLRYGYALERRSHLLRSQG